VVEQGTPADVQVEITTETKAEKKAVPQKKKPPVKKKITPKERTEAEKVKDIQGLLEGVFMVASLKGGSHWVLSADESKQIAVPLSKILDRYDLLGKASEVSDPIALIVAVATIVFPKIIISKMDSDSKKRNVIAQNGGLANANKKTGVASDGGSNGGTVKATDTTHDGQFIKSIHTEVSTGF
jgi:hypothetical protein